MDYGPFGWMEEYSIISSLPNGWDQETWIYQLSSLGRNLLLLPAKFYGHFYLQESIVWYWYGQQFSSFLFKSSFVFVGELEHKYE